MRKVKNFSKHNSKQLWFKLPPEIRAYITSITFLDNENWYSCMLICKNFTCEMSETELDQRLHSQEPHNTRKLWPWMMKNPMKDRVYKDGKLMPPDYDYPNIWITCTLDYDDNANICTFDYASPSGRCAAFSGDSNITFFNHGYRRHEDFGYIKPKGSVNISKEIENKTPNRSKYIERKNTNYIFKNNQKNQYHKNYKRY